MYFNIYQYKVSLQVNKISLSQEVVVPEKAGIKISLLYWSLDVWNRKLC